MIAADACTAAAAPVRPSAAAAAVAPAQLPLNGLPPPVHLLRVAIVGHLVRQGELRISADGRTHLVVQVLQPGDGLAFVAIYHALPGEEARADIERMAEQMQPGTAVVVVGHGIKPDQHHGHPVLSVLRCTALCLAHVPTFFPQPHEAPQ